MSNELRRCHVVLILLAAAACAAPPEIEQSSVERIIGTLAADDMQGRRSFTPAADRAAEFIRAEFEAIGLETFAGSADHLQRFPVHSATVQSSEVSLNGAPVPAERVAMRLSAASIEWTPAHAVELLVVGADDSPMTAFRAMRAGGPDRLVLMNSAHAAMFGRLRGFLGGANRTLDPGDGGNTVLVLTDATAPRSFRVVATARSESVEIANVVAVIPGRRADEMVLFSAHYDHIGIVEAVDGDSIANGANDDASGTTAVIELARYFAALGEPERTLVFAAFIAEEMGGYGSRYFSSQLDPDQIVAMFKIEMIGKVGVRGPGSAWITGFERSDFGTILQQAVEGSEYEFYADPYPDQRLFYRSDNVTLARLGVPAHSISTTPIDVDPDYHEVSDEVDTLDLENLTNTIRAIAAGASTIVDGFATPSRLEPVTGE